MVGKIMRDVTDDMRDSLAESLLKAMTDNPTAQGYAAPQLNIRYRAFVTRRKGVMTFMFNPKIAWKFGSIKSNEGCESCKGRWVVRRPLLLKVIYEDSVGTIHEEIKWYKDARIICHEMDHLRDVDITQIGKQWWGNKYVK